MFRFLFLFLPFMLFAQIGVNTENPHQESDMHLASKNKTLILNHVEDLNKITQPYKGMIIYDETENCFRGYQQDGWSPCFGSKADRAVVSVDGPGFVGEYIVNKPLTNASYRVTIKNNSFSSATIAFGLTDLVLSDPNVKISSLQYINPAGNVVNMPSEGLTLNSGASFVIVYNLTGTPTKLGKLLGNWEKLALNFQDDVDISYFLNCNTGDWSQPLLPAAWTGLQTNESYTGVYELGYDFDATGFTFPAYSETKDGLTLSMGATEGAANGELQYTLSGTYTGASNRGVKFTINNECIINVPIGFVNVINGGFTGDYFRGENLTSTNTYEITLINNGTEPFTTNFRVSDLNIVGNGITVSGIKSGTLTSDSAISVTFAPNETKTIVYTLTGTPGAPHTQIDGEWNNNGVVHNDSVNVDLIYNCSVGEWTTPLTPIPDEGLMNGISYSGVYEIALPTDATGYNFPAYTQTVKGLTLTADAVTGGPQTKFTYTLSGTYNGIDNGYAIFDLQIIVNYK